MACTFGSSRFLLYRTHDEEAAPWLCAYPCRRSHKSCQWSLGVDAAAAVEQATLLPNIDPAGHGVNMSKQQNGTLSTAQLANCVARSVDMGTKTECVHLLDQVAHSGLLVTGWAVAVD
jgi:hypothetical protein